MNDREFDEMIRAQAGAEVFSVPERTRVRLDRASKGAPSRRISRRVLLAAAVLIVALAGIAYAAARGGYLRNLFTGDASDIDPASVVDVDATGGTEEFSFTIDETYWEGDQLYLAYTLRVPGDGARLVAFDAPTMDGERLGSGYGMFTDDAILWVAEDGVSEISGVFPVVADADGEAHEIAMTAYLMRPIIPIKGVTWEEYTALRDGGAFDEGDYLYYAAGEKSDILGGWPFIELRGTAKVRQYLNETDDWVWEDENSPDETRTPSVEMMKELGFAEAVDSAEVRFGIEGSSQVACPVTGVAEDEIDMGDYTIRVPKFTMTHFSMEVLIRVYTDEKEGLLVGRKFDIQTEDGTSLIEHFHCFGIEGGTSQDEEGRLCVEYWYDGSGFLGEIPARVVLVPYKRDENGERVLDMEHAVTLTLVAEEAEALPEGMAYATKGGTYYHSDPACMGMIGAELVPIEEAEARGQKPCPLCMGN